MTLKMNEATCWKYCIAQAVAFMFMVFVILLSDISLLTAFGLLLMMMFWYVHTCADELDVITGNAKRKTEWKISQMEVE